MEDRNNNVIFLFQHLQRGYRDIRIPRFSRKKAFINNNWCSIRVAQQGRNMRNNFQVPYDMNQLMLSYFHSTAQERLLEGHQISLREGERATDDCVHITWENKGEIWLHCVGIRAVFIESYYLNKQDPECTEHKILPGQKIKIFDVIEYCQDVILQTVAEQFEDNDESSDTNITTSNSFDVDKWKRYCIINLWFSNGNGESNLNYLFELEVKQATIQFEEIVRINSKIR